MDLEKLTGAVEGGSDADLGAAGGDGGGEVGTHTHGELAQGDAEAGGELVAERAEIRKRALGVRGGLGGGGAEGCDRHEAVDAEIFPGEGEFDEARAVGEIGAEFGGIVAGVDLEQHRENFAQLAGGAVEVVEKFFRFYALDAVEGLGGEFGLVGLEVADEFPNEGGGGAERALLGGFLHAVLADGAEAVARGVIGGGDGVGLGDGEEFDGRGIAAGRSAGGGDLGADGVGAAGEIIETNVHGKRVGCLEILIRGLRRRGSQLCLRQDRRFLMQIENLKIFADLVETKSFSKAAKLNGITQSAVSQQARAMERHFKTLLVDRSQKQFQLTREGFRVYESAKEMLHTFEKLMCELQEMKKVISGTIRISTIYSIGLHELPPFIKKFLHDFPAVNVRVEYRRSNLVYEDILHNAVDFGLVAFPVKQRQIEVLPFRNDHLVLITPPNHPLAKRTEIEVKELAGQKFIGFDPDIPTRKAVDQIFRDHKLEIEPVMEFDNIETVKRAVEIDHGIAIVPQATVAQEVKQGTLAMQHFKGKALTRPLAILHRKGRVLTPAMKKFIDILGLDLPEMRDT